MSTSLTILILWGLTGCMNAIFAAPVGNEFSKSGVGHSNKEWDDTTKSSKNSEISPGFWDVVKTSWKVQPSYCKKSEDSPSLWRVMWSGLDPVLKRPKVIDKEGYLAANILPQPVFSSLNSSSTDRAEHISTQKPTLSSFLAYLEEEKRLAEVELSTDREDIEPVSGLATPEQNVSDPEFVDPGEVPGGDVTQSSYDNEQTGHEETVIIRADSKPIFPRPYVRKLVEEDLFIYFPVEGVGTLSNPFLMGSPDAIFLPPESETLMSSATVNIEP